MLETRGRLRALRHRPEADAYVIQIDARPARCSPHALRAASATLGDPKRGVPRLARAARAPPDIRLQIPASYRDGDRADARRGVRGAGASARDALLATAQLGHELAPHARQARARLRRDLRRGSGARSTARPPTRSRRCPRSSRRTPATPCWRATSASRRWTSDCARRRTTCSAAWRRRARSSRRPTARWRRRSSRSASSTSRWRTSRSR